MAKYILREEALSHPFANGKYDHRNADINFILGHESYEEWLETLTAFSEQEIVKPYLEKLMIEVGNLEINKPMMSGYGFKQKSPQEIKDEVMKLIDNLLSEREVMKE